MPKLSERLSEKAAASHLHEVDPAILRDYYQSVLDSVGSVVYTVNRDLRITGVNKQWDDFARANNGEHLIREHVLGSHLLDQMTGAPLERWRVVCEQLINGEIPRYLDEIASEEPYAWRNFSLSATPLRDSQGSILGITFVASNITQLKKAEYEMFQRLVEIRGLRQVAQVAGGWLERRKVYKQITSDIAHLLDAAKCVIFLWDEQTGNLQAQEPAFGLAGRKLADLWLDMGHPADPDSLWDDLEEKDYILLNEGDDAPADMVETSSRVDRLAAMLGILRVSARVHGLILVAGRDDPFTDQDGQLLALFAVPIALSIENTELNRRLLDRAEQLSTTREQLDHAIKTQEAIRTPLSVMRGYLELLKDGAMGPLSEAQMPTLQMIIDKTQAVMGLISRTIPPRMPHDAARYERIHLADLVRRAINRRLSGFEKAGINLVTQLPPPRDEESVTLGDPDMLLRAFNALLDNAVKYSPDGGTLEISLHVSGDIVYVKIADSGIGIPPDQLLHIWKAQERSGPSEPINLAEVKRIVEGHGGQVWAESTPGRGSTFQVVLRKVER
jgi:signal transduction histidine kinase